MADKPRFGTAGIPSGFASLKQSVIELPNYLKEQGLDALEYEAVRWGGKPQMGQILAEKLAEQAVLQEIWLTIHGSYYINLAGDTKTVEESQKRLIASATAAKWLKAHTVVFHLGYYSQKRSHKEDLRRCIEALRKVSDEMQSMNIKAKLGPETSGRLAQLGSLEEVITICESVDQVEPVIDWGHLHARLRGGLRHLSDFQRVVETIDERLGSSAAKNLHCHFSFVEYSFRGERRHLPLNTPNQGPRFESLADVIHSNDLKPVIISESPHLEEDAKRMRDTFYQRQQAR